MCDLHLQLLGFEAASDFTITIRSISIFLKNIKIQNTHQLTHLHLRGIPYVWVGLLSLPFSVDWQPLDVERELLLYFYVDVFAVRYVWLIIPCDDDFIQGSNGDGRCTRKSSIVNLFPVLCPRASDPLLDIDRIGGRKAKNGQTVR